MSIGIGLEVFVDNFARMFPKNFNIEYIQKELAAIHIHVKREEIIEALKKNPQILFFHENCYASKLAFFENYFFSILPTKFEIANNIMITGHRCMPFADFERPPHEIEFFYNGKKIPKKIFEMQTSFIYAYYALFGEEYIPQYLELDPADNDISLYNGSFDLPTQTKITVLDMKSFYKKHDFTYGDRLLCKVTDRLELYVCVDVKKNTATNPFEKTPELLKREKWFNQFEKSLKKTIASYGPCSSIDEQLTYLFFHDKQKLSTEYAGSVEEFLKDSDAFGFELFGVETRLWSRNSKIPLVGSWNSENFLSNDDTIDFQSLFGVPLTERVINAYLLDSLYLSEPNCAKLFERLIPHNMLVYENELYELHNFVEKKYRRIKKTYNKFADFDIGKLRNRVLQLYSNLFTFVCELTNSQIPLTHLPAQPVVILSQLFSHVHQMIDSLEQPSSVGECDLVAWNLSLEGMEFSFQEIYEEIIEQIDSEQKRKFIVVK